VLGMFLLARDILGSSFYALLSMIVLAMGPTTLLLANLPNSHAPALCFVVWGMFFLFRWWQGEGGWPIGALAGLLLGIAVTVRYTEALLLFPLYSLEVIRDDQYIGPKLLPVLRVLGFLPLGPLGLAAMSRVKWRSWRSYLSAAVPVMAWAIPVGMLVGVNWFTVGHFSGYDSTHESSGFSIDNAVRKWDFTIYQVYLFGLFIFAPLGVAGLIVMFQTARRAALLLTLWFVPGALLYTAYYWGQDLQGLGFLRFFLTLFPPLIIAAMFMLKSAEIHGRINGRRAIAPPLAAGVLVAIATVIGVGTTLDELERQHRGNLNLYYSAEQVLSHVKPRATGGRRSTMRPMMFTDSGMFPQFLQYMQFMVDADWYAGDAFTPRVGGGFGIAGFFQHARSESDSHAPVLLQQERIDYIDSVRRGKTDADYIHDELRLMDQALHESRKVYAILSPQEATVFRSRYITAAGAYEMVELTRWTEPCEIHYPEPNARQWLAPPSWGDSALLPWHAQSRVMFEIRRAQAGQSAPAP
jgi:hypothetical protein